MTEPVCAVTYALVGPLHQIEVSKTCFGYMLKYSNFMYWIAKTNVNDEHLFFRGLTEFASAFCRDLNCTCNS